MYGGLLPLVAVPLRKEAGKEYAGEREGNGVKRAVENMEKVKRSFVVYTEYHAAIKEMSDTEAGIIFKALLEYAESGFSESVSVPPALTPVYAMMKNQIDRENEKYSEQCRKNKEAIKRRWEYKNNQNIRANTDVYERIQVNTKHTDKDKDRDKDKDKDKDRDKDKDKDKDRDKDSLSISDEIEKEKEKEKKKRYPTDTQKKNAAEPPAEPPREGVFLAEYVREAWKEFVSMRKTIIKKPMTGNAERRMIARLEKMCGGDSLLAEKIIWQSVDFHWQDLYAYKGYEAEKGKGGRAADSSKAGINWEKIAAAPSESEAGINWERIAGGQAYVEQE